jgi:hypothetical protein
MRQNISTASYAVLGGRLSCLWNSRSHFELVLNVRTAKAVGVSIPDAIRVRADGVIE